MRGKYILLLFLSTSLVWAQGALTDAALTRGWDIFTVPLAAGHVFWNATDVGNGQLRFSATFQVQGAEPNHQYTAGVHFFEPPGTSRPGVNQFGGLKIGAGHDPISREGVTATLIGAWDFGVLATDSRGNGSATFSYVIPAQAYDMQFTVRAGKCVMGLDESGCAAVFRTGGKLGQSFEVIRAPAATAPSASPCALGLEVNTDRYAGDYATLQTSNAESCCAACEHDPKCRSFAWVASQKTCYLKSTTPPRTSMAGVTSGVKANTAPAPQSISTGPAATPPCRCGQMVITYAQKQPITIPLDQVASIDWRLMEVDIKAAPRENWGRGASVMLIRLKSGKVQEFDLRQPPRIEFVCGGEER